MTKGLWFEVSYFDVTEDHFSEVAGVVVMDEHFLRVLFRDGLCGDVLLSVEEMTGPLAPLRDPAYFARVRVDQDAGTLVWPDGEQITADKIYQQAWSGQLL